LIFLLFTLCLFPTQQSYSEPLSDPSSISEFITFKDKPTKGDLDRLKIIADSLYDYGDLERYSALIDSAYSLSQLINYKELVVLFNRWRGLHAQDLGDLKLALQLYEETLDYDKKWGFTDQISIEYINMGNTYLDLGNYAKALGSLLQSKETYVGKFTSRVYLELLNTLAIVYENLQQPNDAKRIYDEFFELASAAQDTSMLVNYYINTFDLLRQMGNIEEGEENLYKAIDLFSDGVDRKLLYAYNFLGEINQARKELDKAEYYFFKSKKIADSVGIVFDRAMNLASIADFYRDTNRPQLAILYADTTLQLTQSNEYNLLTYQMYWTKSFSDSVLNRTESSFENYKKYIYYRDLVHNEESAKEVQRIEMQAEFDKKEAVFGEELKRRQLQRNLSFGGLLITIIFAGVFFTQRNRIRTEKDRSEGLLLNILPFETAQELKQKGYADAQVINQVTVLFTDFKGFTELSEALSPSDLVAAIHECFSAFDTIMEKHKVEKIKTIGDAYMAAGGLPTENTTHPEDVIKAALDIQAYMQKHIQEKRERGLPYFEIRIGVHTGPVVAGIVGIKKFQYDIWGDTVNTASRMESSGEVGRVNISQTTYEQIKNRFDCEYRGEIEAKGKGKIGMYFVKNS
jgi:class 3 adenylate cyclase